jgi:DNA replication licensing factor MCM4
MLSVHEIFQCIEYAKENCNPVLSKTNEEKLIEGYLDLRSTKGKNVVSATPRQLQSLIRISEAFAKMCLLDVVEESDVEETLLQSATDPSTGIIDMDVVATGTSYDCRQKMSLIECEVRKMLMTSVE